MSLCGKRRGRVEAERETCMVSGELIGRLLPTFLTAVFLFSSGCGEKPQTHGERLPAAQDELPEPSRAESGVAETSPPELQPQAEVAPPATQPEKPEEVAPAVPSIYVWLEGERPREASFEFKAEPTKKPGLLSDGKWLQAEIGKGEAKKLAGEGGLRLSYSAKIPEPGEYEVWARVGYEGARPPFEWRIGGAGWKKLPPEEHATNLMVLDKELSIEWLRLGSADLAAGNAALEIRYPAPGPDGRMLVGLDCIVVTKGRFVPEGRLKPGERYDSEDDLKAAAKVFELPAPKGVERVTVKLSGTWQVARFDDPDVDKDTYEPVRKLPAPDEYPLRWMGITVPMSLRRKAETDLAHRVIYRTKVDVPAAHAGRGFYLHFAGTNWIVSVFVNGSLAGTHRGVWIPWDMDVSNFVEPGKVNEIALAVKSPWYGFDTRYVNVNGKEGPGTLKPFMSRRGLGRPTIVPYGGKGDGNGSAYGIVNAVTLHSVGSAYTDNVFVKTSVARNTLETEVEVRNAAGAERRLRVKCEAVHDKTNKVEKVFGPVDVTVPARSTARVTVAGDWAEPKLWWPRPNPDLYRLRTTILEDGKPVDVHEQLFGFREVTIDGTSFRLNGLRYNIWGWWGVKKRIAKEEEYAEELRRERTRFNRFFSHCALTAFRPAQEDRLEYYDRHGIAGCQATMVEGMGVMYILGTYAGGRGKNARMKMNEPVWDEFRRHMRQIAKAYRNHPSVLMYSLENETVYINVNNFWGHVMWSGISYHDYMVPHEEAMAGVARAGQEFDDTRPYVVSGAGDLHGLLPMNTPHYPRGPNDWYPENAYTVERTSDHTKRWPWKKDKPWYAPESTFGDDLGLATCALGDEGFRSQRDARRGKAVFQRMLFGGYRWAGTAGWSCCGNYSEFPEVQAMLSDLCVIPRKQTHRLYGGRENRLLFKVMNDTFSREPVTFEWRYEVDGRRIAGEKLALDIEPGFGEERTIVITPPETRGRLEGTLTLKAGQPGADTYVDVRSVPVLPVVGSLRISSPVTVLDRSGKLVGFLKTTGLRFETIRRLADVKGRKGLLIVGPDTLTPEEAYGPTLLAAVYGGLRAVVLEQQNVLAGSGLPIPVATTTHYGGYVHPQGLGTPIFRDLGKDDLINWAGDHPTYRNVYRKPSSGARSLAHCGGMLPYSALLEIPCGRGFLVLCQLRVGAKLGQDAAADILLRNMIEHYAGARPSKGVVAIYAPGDPLLARNLKSTGVLTETVKDLEAALDPGKFKVAAVHATKENLAALNANKARANRFQDAGGWIVLCGLDPNGLPEFNSFLGADHVIRPFRVERVTFEGTGHPLAATLGNLDVGLISNRHIIHGRMWPSGNTYGYVIDGTDFAPFCRVPGGPADPFEYTPTGNDHDPYNYVNTLFDALSWRCIRQIWWDQDRNRTLPLTFTLRRPDVVGQINIWNNANYSTIRDLDVIFDGDEAGALSVVLPDSHELTEVKLPRPRKVQRTITLRLKTKRIGRNANLVGIDNVQFLRPAGPRGAAFLDNVGGLVAFSRGKGGVFLCQVKFMEKEPNARNAAKKRNLVGVLLQNMGAGVSTGVALPGVNVRCEPVDIVKYCNQYRDSRWVKDGVWFGRRGEDLGAFDAGDGETVLADVAYGLVRFTTAPRQDCIMLGAAGAPKQLPEAVRGVPVGKKCDLLFFLHTVNVTKPVTADERKRMGARRRPFRLPEVMRYVLHYADGKTESIPVVLEKHVDHWLQAEPKPLEGAAVAWTGEMPGAGGRKAVLYSMKARNPRPDVAIKSIDIELGRDAQGKPVNRAVPAVLAITLGELLEGK